MSVNSVSANTGNYSETYAATTSSKQKETTQTTDDKAAVYEKSSDSSTKGSLYTIKCLQKTEKLW